MSDVLYIRNHSNSTKVHHLSKSRLFANLEDHRCGDVETLEPPDGSMPGDPEFKLGVTFNYVSDPRANFLEREEMKKNFMVRIDLPSR